VVMKGYYADEQATEDAFAGGWFHSGDVGVMHPDGWLELRDRKKDVIISGGENVSSVEVEDCLYQHPAVAEVAVIGVPHDRWGETVKALVVLREAQAATEADLIAHCRDRMAHYKCPTSIDATDVLPRNPSGKILKRELRAPYWAEKGRSIN